MEGGGSTGRVRERRGRSSEGGEEAEEKGEGGEGEQRGGGRERKVWEGKEKERNGSLLSF